MKINIAQKTRALVESTVLNMGYTLWDVTYLKEGAEWTLSVEIDKADGITIEDCSAVNDAIEPLIDEADFVENAYCFEVASAGLERDLRLPEHYEYAMKNGIPVAIKLFTPVNGKKEYTAAVIENGQSAVTLTQDGGSIIIDKKNIAKAHISM